MSVDHSSLDQQPSFSLRLLDIDLVLTTGTQDLIDYANNYFGANSGQLVKNPSVSVTLNWTTHWFQMLPGGSQKRLIPQVPLGLTISGTAPDETIDSTFDVAVSYNDNRVKNIARSIIRRWPVDPILDALLYPSVMFPLWAAVQHKLGTMPISASAIDIDGTGILIVGGSGVGKSTLALSAIDLIPKARLLSDNIVLVNGTRAFAFLEPIRLDEASVRVTRIEENADEIHGLIGDSRSFRLKENKTAATSNISKVVFPKFGTENYIHQIDRETAINNMNASQLSAHEIIGYRSYTSLFSSLKPLDPVESTPQNELFENVDYFELAVSKDTTINKAIGLLAEPTT